jgi:hypothetical protein
MSLYNIETNIQDISNTTETNSSNNQTSNEEFHNQSGRENRERTTELANPLQSVIMTARIRHYHALVSFRIESNSNIFVVTFLPFRCDLLNEHLIYFAFFPVVDIVEDFRGVLIFHTCMIAWIWALCSFRVTLVQVAHGIIQIPYICVRYKPHDRIELSSAVYKTAASPQCL